MGSLTHRSRRHSARGRGLVCWGGDGRWWARVGLTGRRGSIEASLVQKGARTCNVGAARVLRGERTIARVAVGRTEENMIFLSTSPRRGDGGGGCDVSEWKNSSCPGRAKINFEASLDPLDLHGLISARTRVEFERRSSGAGRWRWQSVGAVGEASRRLVARAAGGQFLGKLGKLQRRQSDCHGNILA